MKKNYMRHNNKGAALISIMIAVAFITILATSLLSIAVNNYHMKAVNAKSKNNFYMTEQKLNVFTNEVRNIAANSTNPVNDICTNIGCASPNFSSAGWKNAYSTDAIAKLAFPDDYVSGSSVTKDHVVYTFSSVAPDTTNNITCEQDSSVSRLKTVTVKGVKITSTPEAGYEGYTDSIITDIKFQVLEAPKSKSKGGIGKFSVMLDAPIKFTNSTAPIRWNVYGNAFMSSYGSVVGKCKKDDGTIDINGGTRQGADPALTVDGNSCLNFVGDNMIVYGDILIKDQGVFSALGGSITVYGDIKVQGNGAFICTSDIYMMNGTNPYTSAAYGIYNTTGKSMNCKYKSINYLEPEEVFQFKEALKLHDETNTNDGLVASIINQATDLKSTSKKFYFYEMVSGEEKKMSTNFNGRTIGCDIFGKNPVNGDFNNQLVFLYNAGNKTTPIEVQQTNAYCTFISLNPVEFKQQHDVNLTNLGDEAFDYLTMKAADSIYTYDADAHEINCRASSSSYNDDNARFKIGDFFTDKANETVQTALGAASKNGGTPKKPDATAVGYASWKKE